MSGTLQPAQTATQTISGGQSGVVPVSYGYYPPEGSRCVTAQYNWTSQIGYAEDLSQLVARGVETSIQSAYIDNSANPLAVTLLVLGTEQVVTCPAGGQGIFPLFFTGTPGFQISVTALAAGAVTRVYLLNVPGGGGVWFPSAPGGLQATYNNPTLPTYQPGTAGVVAMSSRGVLLTTIAAPDGTSLIAGVANGATPQGLTIGAFHQDAPAAVGNGISAALQVDTRGSLNVNTETAMQTYSAALFFATVATATDVFTIYGSATKTVRVRELKIAGNAGQIVTVVKRSTQDTGGTTTPVSSVPHDSANAAPTAVITAYTANPATLGTSLGNVEQDNYPANGPPLVWPFGVTDQAIVLRGVNEGLCIGFNGAGATGGFSIKVKWSEV